MRLLTHNMLSCNIKGVTAGFPLILQPTKTLTKPADLNPDFLRGILARLDWPALVAASRAVGYSDLPEDQPAPPALDDEDGDLIKKFHHALLEIHVEEGAMVCPETGRRFPISKGIPNMLLNEDEV